MGTGESVWWGYQGLYTSKTSQRERERQREKERERETKGERERDKGRERESDKGRERERERAEGRETESLNLTPRFSKYINKTTAAHNLQTIPV